MLNSPVRASSGLQWTVMIANDDQSIHDAAQSAFFGKSFQGRALRIINAYSAEQAMRMLDENRDIALIFLNAVMESEDAGLRVVKYLRDEIGNAATRIIMQTEQSDVEPEIEIIARYDIHDYKHKSELSEANLLCAARTAISAYRALITINSTREELQKSLSGLLKIRHQLEAVSDDSSLRLNRDRFWTVLIVDDDQSMHDVTKLALSGKSFLNRKLRFLDVYSGEQAMLALSQDRDIALVFLDVVMETDDAGLRVVNFLRNELGNKITRVVLRTGQPGQAPEMQIISQYDINDYKHKTELTAPKLFCTVQSAISTYRDLVALDSTRRDLQDTLNQLQLNENQLEMMYRREQRIALSFQEASLPRTLPTVPGMIFHSYYAPGDQDASVGGDWYDAVRLLDGRVILSIGDVAGGGLNAAIVMSTMRQIIRGSGYVQPDPVLMLNAADKMLRTEYPETIVTAFVGVLDPIERSLTYATAGHPPPILRLPDGTLRELSHEGLVLGLRGHSEQPAARLNLIDGSLLMLYTDGLVESRQNFLEGERRLRDALMNEKVCASPDIAKAIYEAVLYDGIRDDVAILTLECLPLPLEALAVYSRWIFDSLDVHAAKTAQMELSELLRKDGICENDIIGAELVFAELIGNVVRYAPGQVEIVMDWSTSLPVLHVIDRGPGFSCNPKLPDLLSESGRGIFLVSKLSEEFHVSVTPSGGSHACSVLDVNGSHVRERRRLPAFCETLAL